MATESSVRVNLKDLFEMEAQRRADEAAARERARAEATAREERERREREDAIRAARDEERRRAETERAAQSAAVEGRIAKLRDELALVRAAREASQAQLDEIVARSAAPRSSRGSWLAGGMAARSLVAALTATFVAWPRPEAAVPPSVLAVTEPAPATADVEPAVVVAPPSDAVDADPTPVGATETAPTVRPRPRPRPRVEEEPDLAQQLDFGTGDGLIPD